MVTTLRGSTWPSPAPAGIKVHRTCDSQLRCLSLWLSLIFQCTVITVIWFAEASPEIHLSMVLQLSCTVLSCRRQVLALSKSLDCIKISTYCTNILAGFLSSPLQMLFIIVYFRMATEMILQKSEAASMKLTCKCSIRTTSLRTTTVSSTVKCLKLSFLAKCFFIHSIC